MGGGLLVFLFFFFFFQGHSRIHPNGMSFGTSSSTIGVGDIVSPRHLSSSKRSCLRSDFFLGLYFSFSFGIEIACCFNSILLPQPLECWDHVYVAMLSWTLVFIIHCSLCSSPNMAVSCQCWILSCHCNDLCLCMRSEKAPNPVPQEAYPPEPRTTTLPRALVLRVQCLLISFMFCLFSPLILELVFFFFNSIILNYLVFRKKT